MGRTVSDEKMKRGLVLAVLVLGLVALNPAAGQQVTTGGLVQEQELITLARNTPLDQAVRIIQTFANQVVVAPRDLTAPRVEVFLANRLLGTVTVTEGFQPYAFDIAPDHAREIGDSDEPVQVSIASNTWSPSAALDADDSRNLGVMVDRLVLE